MTNQFKLFLAEKLAKIFKGIDEEQLTSILEDIQFEYESLTRDSLPPRPVEILVRELTREEEIRLMNYSY